MSGGTAAKKWVAIAADVVAYELEHTTDGELLSEVCDRMIAKHPITSRVVILAIGIPLTLHVANLMPKKYDIIGREFWRSVAQHLARKKF